MHMRFHGALGGQLAHRAQCVAHGHGVALFHSDVRKAAYAYRQLSGVQLHNAAPLGVLIAQATTAPVGAVTASPAAPARSMPLWVRQSFMVSLNTSSSPLKACKAAPALGDANEGVCTGCELAGAAGADEAGDELGADETVLCGFDDEDGDVETAGILLLFFYGVYALPGMSSSPWICGAGSAPSLSIMLLMARKLAVAASPSDEINAR